MVQLVLNLESKSGKVRTFAYKHVNYKVEK